MDKIIVAEKINPLVCYNHQNRPAVYKILSEKKETIFLCADCFERMSDTQEKLIRDNTIPLQNRGLYKSSDSVKVKGTISDFAWKDFGKERKNLYLEAEEKSLIRSSAHESLVITFLSFPHKNIGDIKITGKVYDILYSEILDMRIAFKNKIPWFILKENGDIETFLDIRNYRKFTEFTE